MLKANLSSYIQPSLSIVLLYIVQIQQGWSEVGGAQHQRWLQKHSAFFPCQANTRLPKLLRWVFSLCSLSVHPPCCLCKTVTGGWLSSSKSLSFQLCQNYQGGWLQEFRMHRQTPPKGPSVTETHWREVAKPISLNILASYELCRYVYLQIHTWCLRNTLQFTK